MPNSMMDRQLESKHMTNIDSIKIADFVRHHYDSVELSLPGEGKWLQTIRRKNFDSFIKDGTPKRKWESWRYSNTVAVEKALAEACAGESNPETDLLAPPLKQDTYRCIILNGKFRSDLSELQKIPSGIAVVGLADSLRTDPKWVKKHFSGPVFQKLPLAALNTAFLNDGYILSIEPDTILDKPIEVVFLNGFGLIQPHNIVLAGENSKATIIEHYVGEATTYLCNSVTSIGIERGAQISRYKLQRDSQNSQHHALLDSKIDKDGTLYNFELSLGALLAHSESQIKLDAPGANTISDGIYLTQDLQETAAITSIKHASSDTFSDQFYKGVLDGNSRAIFQGKVSVPKNSQRINGSQLNKTLLLSDKAEIDSKPELEIMADDVVCSHGATAGQLDEEALFYLQSRGISEAIAKRILVQAFIEEVYDRMDDTAVRDIFRHFTSKWLEIHAPEEQKLCRP